MLTGSIFGFRLRVFGLVSGENIILVVDVSTEPIVVDFFSVSEIAISSCDEGEFFRCRGHQTKCFQYT